MRSIACLASLGQERFRLAEKLLVLAARLGDDIALARAALERGVVQLLGPPEGLRSRHEPAALEITAHHFSKDVQLTTTWIFSGAAPWTDAEHLSRWRGRLCRLGAAEAEVVEDSPDPHLVGHEGDEPHALAAADAHEGVDLVDLRDQPCQLGGWSLRTAGARRAGSAGQ
jgi:hypothetical protein